MNNKLIALFTEPLFIVMWLFIGIFLLSGIRHLIFVHVKFEEETLKQEAKDRGMIVYCIWLFDAYKHQAVYMTLILLLLSIIHQMALHTGIAG